MPISAIDASTLAPRSAEASSIVGKEQQQFQHVGENGAMSFERAVETAKSETEEYGFDGSGSGKYSGGRKKKKKQPKEAPMAPRSDSSFDITI